MTLERQMIQMSLVKTSDGNPPDKIRLNASILDSFPRSSFGVKSDIEIVKRALSFFEY
jgi:hypothetical protein